MKIEVTKANVTTAKRRDSHSCMIADAIHDAADVKYVLVDVQTIRFSDMKKRKRYTYLTPPGAQQAIIRFDQGKSVTPFTFSLGTPVKTRAVQHVITGKIGPKKKARRKYEMTNRKSGSQRVNLAAREREFGVRTLVA